MIRQPSPSRPFRVAGLLLLLGLLAGCSRYHEDAWSRQWPKRVPSGGVVTYRGAPVEGALVVFVSERNGRIYDAVGSTDAQGRFFLRTFRPRDGAVPGSHRVKIEKVTYSARPDNVPRDALFTPQETSLLPVKYRSPQTSGLTALVTEKGRNEFVFDLDDAPPPVASRKP